jgi:hypothetical protein
MVQPVVAGVDQEWVDCASGHEPNTPSGRRFAVPVTDPSTVA